MFLKSKSCSDIACLTSSYKWQCIVVGVGGSLTVLALCLGVFFMTSWTAVKVCNKKVMLLQKLQAQLESQAESQITKVAGLNVTKPVDPEAEKRCTMLCVLLCNFSGFDVDVCLQNNSVVQQIMTDAGMRSYIGDILSDDTLFSQVLNTNDMPSLFATITTYFQNNATKMQALNTKYPKESSQLHNWLSTVNSSP